MAIGVNTTISSADLTGQATGTKTISLPAGTAATDVIILQWSAFEGASTDTLNTPVGWTQLYNVSTTNCRLWVYWAFGNVANLGFTYTNPGGAAALGWTAVGFTGCDQTTPIDVTGTAGTNTGSASITANAVTIATANAWELIATTDASDGSFSATGFTYKSNGSTTGQRVGLLYNTTPKSVGGSGTVLCSNSAAASGQELIVAPFALRPATAAAFTWQQLTGTSADLIIPRHEIVAY